MPIPISDFDNGSLPNDYEIIEENSIPESLKEYESIYHIEWSKKLKAITFWRKTKIVAQTETRIPCFFCGHPEQHPCTREGCKCITFIMPKVE